MELQGPLAITVIGGLTASTVLTLFVVPILYVLLSGSSGRSRRRPAALPAWARRCGHNHRGRGAGGGSRRGLGARGHGPA